MLDESDERRTAVLRTLPTRVDEWSVVVRRSVGRDFRGSRATPAVALLRAIIGCVPERVSPRLAPGVGRCR